MDAGLAKVMNSSVGTSTLKALDAILKTDNTAIANNAADRLFNSLKNSAKLIGSDDVMFTYSGEWTYGSGSGNNPIFGSGFNHYLANSFVQFDTSGAVTIKTVQTGARTDAKHTFYLRVYDSSGNQITTTAGNLANGTTAEIKLDFNVTAGSKYKFAIGGYNVGSLSPNLNVCGKTVIFGATATITS